MLNDIIVIATVTNYSDSCSNDLSVNTAYRPPALQSKEMVLFMGTHASHKSDTYREEADPQIRGRNNEGTGCQLHVREPSAEVGWRRIHGLMSCTLSPGVLYTNVPCDFQTARQSLQQPVKLMKDVY